MGPCQQSHPRYKTKTTSSVWGPRVGPTKDLQDLSPMEKKISLWWWDPPVGNRYLRRTPSIQRLCHFGCARTINSPPAVFLLLLEVFFFFFQYEFSLIQNLLFFKYFLTEFKLVSFLYAERQNLSLKVLIRIVYSLLICQ